MAFSAKDIAQQLCRSQKCIEKRIENIKKVFNVHTTIEILQTVHCDEGNIDNITLTPRGMEVFQLLRKGLTVKEVANFLDISISAVKRHKENMLRTNECKTIKELVSKYYGKLVSQYSTKL